MNEGKGEEAAVSNSGEWSGGREEKKKASYREYCQKSRAICSPSIWSLISSNLHLYPRPCHGSCLKIWASP